MRRAERRGADALCAVSFARACRLDWKRRWQAPLPSTCIPRAPHASALPAVHSRVAKAGTPPARVKHHPVPAQDNSPSTFSAQSPAATHVVALNETSPSSHTTHRVPSARPHVGDAVHFPPTRTTSRLHAMRSLAVHRARPFPDAPNAAHAPLRGRTRRHKRRPVRAQDRRRSCPQTAQKNLWAFNCLCNSKSFSEAISTELESKSYDLRLFWREKGA